MIPTLLQVSSRNILLLVCAGVISFTAAAQEIGSIVTDRPDQTESSTVLSPGFLQLETGFTHVEDDDSEVDFKGDYFPETLFRYGLCERLEIRFVVKGHAWEKIETRHGFIDKGFGGPSGGNVERLQGWQDTEVGVKYKLWDEVTESFVPDAALLTHLSLPTGNEDFTTEEADPSFRFLFSNTITDTLSIGYNFGMAFETDEDDLGDKDTLSVFQYTFAINKTLNEKWSLFAEVFGDVPMSADGKPMNSVDGGFTYLVSDNFQLDVSAGKGLSECADDCFLGAGVSYRWPR